AHDMRSTDLTTGANLEIAGRVPCAMDHKLRLDGSLNGTENAVHRTDTLSTTPLRGKSEVLMKTEDSVSKDTDKAINHSHPRRLTRRQLMRAGGAAATAFTIVPRHVLGGAGFVAPSEKITLACIGFGTQAIREIGGILASPDVQVVAVCDVEKDGVHYLEWG